MTIFKAAALTAFFFFCTLTGSQSISMSPSSRMLALGGSSAFSTGIDALWGSASLLAEGRRTEVFFSHRMWIFSKQDFSGDSMVPACDSAAFLKRSSKHALGASVLYYYQPSLELSSESIQVGSLAASTAAALRKKYGSLGARINFNFDILGPYRSAAVSAHFSATLAFDFLKFYKGGAANFFLTGAVNHLGYESALDIEKEKLPLDAESSLRWIWFSKRNFQASSGGSFKRILDGKDKNLNTFTAGTELSFLSKLCIRAGWRQNLPADTGKGALSGGLSWQFLSFGGSLELAWAMEKSFENSSLQQALSLVYKK